MVISAVCILLGEKSDWISSKKVIASSDFMDRLKTYNKNNISPNILYKFRKIRDKPEFNP